MIMKKRRTLYSILSKHYTRFALIPIFVIEVVLLILYFSINHYIAKINVRQLEQASYSYSTNLLKKEADRISLELSVISNAAYIMQQDHQNIFANPKEYRITDKPQFAAAPNGVFYKTNKKGGSLYYSSHTKIGAKERAKATFTEAMDPLLKTLVDSNPNIVAAYFNSYDDMNRLYPFIDKVYEQYGSHIHMEDYNFYYLGDAEHDPDRKPVWTEAYLDPAGNGWMMSCVVPVYKGNFLEGVSGLDITIDSFVKNILDVSLPYDAEIFMVDPNGTIMAMPATVERLLGLKELKSHVYSDAITSTVHKPEEYNLFKNKSPLAEHFKKMFQENLDHAEFETGNSSYLTLQETVQATGWHLMILIDKAKVLKDVNSYRSLSNKIGYFAIAFMSLFYIAFFYMLSRKSVSLAKEITAPVEELTAGTSQVGHTDYVPEIVDTQIKEIYQLSENFSKMAAELNVHKNHLEDMVTERTSQLKKTNEKLVESEAKYIALYKEAEETNIMLKKAQGTIIQQEKLASIGQLAAGIAHELNNPIGFVSSNFATLQLYIANLCKYYSAVRNALESSEENIDTEEIDKLKSELQIDYIKDDLQTIFSESEEGLDRVTSIVKNLMSFSRIDVLEQMSSYDINNGLTNTLGVARNEIGYVADVVTDFGEVEPVEANGSEINQVFLNIIINAVQAIKGQNRPGKGSITIKTRQENGWAVCSIKDDGPGIPEEKLGRIFDPFYTTKETGQGTGLGLNISYDIVVNKHKGKIDVQSSGKGTEFVIYLPLRHDYDKHVNI